MRTNKFATWDWNFGYSPGYIFEKEEKLSIGTLKVNLKTHKGRISEISFSSDLFPDDSLSEIEILLLGAKHDKDCIMQILKEKNPNLNKISIDEVLEMLF